MRLIDTESNCSLSLKVMKEEYQTLRQDEPWNHRDNFRTELLETMLATVNGRNDCEITGLTARELDRYIRKLRDYVNSH